MHVTLLAVLSAGGTIVHASRPEVRGRLTAEQDEQKHHQKEGVHHKLATRVPEAEHDVPCHPRDE